MKTATETSKDADEKHESKMGERGDHMDEQTPSQIAEKKKAELHKNWDVPTSAPFVKHAIKKRVWPEVTHVKINTKPWNPPIIMAPPKPVVEYPPLELKRWVPPYMKQHRQRPPLLRIPPEEMTQKYENIKLNKIWHNFSTVTKGRMILQGTTACNSKRYSSIMCGNQTAAIAVITRAVMAERSAATLTRIDIDNLIWHGDRYHRQTLLARKCYKGNPSLQPTQLMTNFYYGDARYTIKVQEIASGKLLRHPDEPKGTEDLMSMMQKYVGKEYAMVMSIGDRHWFVWGAPPASGGPVRTVCFIFNPLMLDSRGVPGSVSGFGAFLRYAGVASFVSDMLTHYATLARGGDARRVVFTEVSLVNCEQLQRLPEAAIEIRAAHCHCEDECRAIAYTAFVNSGFKGEIAANSLSRTRKRVQELLKVEDTTKKTGLVPPSEPAPKMVNDDEILAKRGSNFFLYAQRPNMHMYGRDELIPFPKDDMILHSAVEIETSQFHSQYNQCDAEMWILPATRHMGSKRYQQYRVMQGLAVCLAAIATLSTLRARAWNEDVLDEAIDAGTQLYEESIMEAGPPAVAGQSRLILAEIKDTVTIGGVEWSLKVRGVVVWGRLASGSSLILDLTRGLETFFKDCDAGILQLPGEVEVAIWCECSRYFMFQPMPADRKGNRVGLREGGKAFLAMFSRVNRLSELFISNLPSEKRKHPFSISEVNVTHKEPLPAPVYKFKAIAPQRWIVSGSLHNKSDHFPQENIGKQSSAIAVAAIAIAHLHDPGTWTPDNVDDALVRGDILYGQTFQKTAPKLKPAKTDDVDEEGDEEPAEGSEGRASVAGGSDSGPGAPGFSLDSLLTKFRVSEYDCIETELESDVHTGLLTAADTDDTLNLHRALTAFFRNHTHGVVCARGKTISVWRHDDHFYYFEPEACDENGSLVEGMGSACLVRAQGNPSDLASIIEANLPASSDESFYVSGVWVATSRLNDDTGVPEPRLEQKEFSWVSAGRAALLRGARGEHAGAGPAAAKARSRPTGAPLVLPAAVAFTAATAVVRPDYMTADHLHNIIEAASVYYLKHNKKTGRSDMETSDMTETLELGANTFTVKIGEPVKLPLRLPDPEPKMEEEEVEEEQSVEEEEEENSTVEKDNTPKEMKNAIAAMMNQPGAKALLVGDYHTLGLWCDEAGLLLAFDPAPLTRTGGLVPQRIAEGEEKRKRRLEDEIVIEEGGEEEEEDAAGESESDFEIEGEGAPSVESIIPDAVSPDAAAALGLYASPSEFIDKLVAMAPLTAAMALSPYNLYPVHITNELTHELREQGPKRAKAPPAAAVEGEDEEGAEAPPPPAEEEDSAPVTVEEGLVGRYYTRLMRSLYVVRGCVAQDESYFLENLNRNNQDVAMAVMGIAVDHIESCAHWKPCLLDALLKYGDRLYTLSIPTAKHMPKIWACDIVPSFDVTNFEVSLEVDQDVVLGDIKSGDKGTVLGVAQGLEKFFQEHTHGVLSAKQYAVGVWRLGQTAFVLWEPHAVGPAGRTTACGAAAVVVFGSEKQLAECFLNNVQSANHTGNNRFTISAVRVTWKLKSLTPPSAEPVPAACNYDLKVLTAYVELAKGRTILRSSIAPDTQKFKRDTVLQSSCGAITAAAASRAVRPVLWTRRTLDGALDAAAALHCSSVRSLGYEFNPDEDVLLPLQVLKRFILGVNYVRFDLHCEFTGRLEHSDPKEMSVRCAIERFFEDRSLGILWSVPHAVAVWRDSDSPLYYMCEPHSCGLSGLRVDGGEDGAACVLTFTSAKLMAYAYLQNVPSAARVECDFAMYSMDVSIHPIKLQGGIDPPMVRSKSPGDVRPVSATSKMDMYGTRRHMDERFRRHPPGTPTCDEMRQYMEAKAKTKLKGRKNESGYLVLPDGSQFLSAQHSQACRRYSANSRGNQCVSNCVMAIGVARVVDICRWDVRTLGLVLDSGDQLHKDSCLHYRPGKPYLGLEQVLRKFYTPRDCVARAVVYESRHGGEIPVGGSKSVEAPVITKLKTEEVTTRDVVPGEEGVTGEREPEESQPEAATGEKAETSEAKAAEAQLEEMKSPPPPPGLYTQLNEFFREERSGILLNEEGTFAVALFRTPRGFFIFDPDDRDKFGRSMPPECIGHGRACLMQFPNVQLLAEKLEANIPCSSEMITEMTAIGRKITKKAIPIKFCIYPVEISTLRRLNRKELR